MSSKKRVHQVIKKFSDAKILKRLIEKYPNQKTSIDGYKDLLKKLRSVEFVENDKTIKCEKFGCTIIDNDGEYAFGPVDWMGVLGSYAHYGDIDFVCNLLWELTYYGFVEKDRVSFWDEIKKRVKGLE